MRPKVSIIVPIYNVEKYLHRCIESLIQQTLKDIEIILVDDESPDNCPKICDSYVQSDSRIKVIHKKNGGLGLARNSGLEIATGEYVAFIDSDDYIDIETYSITYNKAKEKKLDICFFRYNRFTTQSNFISCKTWDKESYFLSKNEINQFTLEMVGSTDKKYGSEKFSISACMAIYKTDVLKQYNIRFLSERIIASEDLIFHLQLLPFVNRIGYLPNTFYHYYYNQNSITTTYSLEKYNRLIKLVDFVKNELSKNFEQSIYSDHYAIQTLRIYRVILKFESIAEHSLTEKIKRIRKICTQTRLNELYNINKKKLSKKDRFIVFCMKQKIILPIILLYKYKTYGK